MSWSGALILMGVLFAFVAVWYTLSYLLSPTMADPDASARITGNCGDTMELAFKISDGRVVQTHAWTDGCATSRSCVDAAARLAYGKDIEQLSRMTMMDVIDEVGSLPETHLHCAQLADTTLQHALKDYVQRQRVGGIPRETAARQQPGGKQGEEVRI